MAAEIGPVWDKIHTWLEKNAPNTLTGINSGATPEQIKEMEEKCRVELPDDFKASYEIHDGSKVVLFENLEFMTINEIIDNWEMMKKLEEDNDFNAPFENSEKNEGSKFKDKWWDPKWISFASDGCGNSLIVDMAPGEGGVLGQIAFWDHEGGDMEWKASSFTEYLKKFQTDLEDDKYVVTEGCGHLNLKE